MIQVQKMRKLDYELAITAIALVLCLAIFAFEVKRKDTSRDGCHRTNFTERYISVFWFTFRFYYKVVIFSGRFVGKLDEEVENLEWAMKRVQHSIDSARRYGNPIEAGAEQWMEMAVTVADHARRTLALRRAATRTWLSDPREHWHFGRDADRTVEVIRVLISRCRRFDRVCYESYPPRLVGGAIDLNSLAGHGGDTIPDSFCSQAPGDRENRETDNDSRGGIGGLRPPVLSSRHFVGVVSPTRDSFHSFGPREGPGGDKDSEDKYEVGNTLSANILEPVHTVSPSGGSRRWITSWKKGKLLGSGSFGTVYEGFTDDGFFFAIKEVSLLDQGSRGKQSLLQLEREISLLSRLEHENIVQYLGTEEDDEKLYIFLELMTEGSLATLYHKNNWRDSNVSAYTRQILDGLKYLHDQNVVHRDIKCANILVDASGSVKLADFGLAKATEITDAKSSKGTAFWMAPEVANPQNRSYGSAADIWSLGCTVLEMLTCQHPYPHLDHVQAFFQLVHGVPPPVSNDISGDARDFIVKCLQVDPDDRPSAARLLDHPFVRKPPTSSSASASPRFNNVGLYVATRRRKRIE